MNNRLIPIAVLLALSAAIAFLGALPQYEAWRTASREERVKKAELNNRASYVDSLRRLDEEVSSRADEFAKLRAAIPDSPQIPLLYELTRQMASESGLLFRDLASSVSSESSDESGGELEEITLNMSAEGTYDAIKEFFASSRSSERFFQVRNISFKAPTEEELFEVAVGLSTYSY